MICIQATYPSEFEAAAERERQQLEAQRAEQAEKAKGVGSAPTDGSIIKVDAGESVSFAQLLNFQSLIYEVVSPSHPEAHEHVLIHLFRTTTRSETTRYP